jgi:hypothetical protein
MLAATALLWSVTRKLFGTSAAVCGATLFAIMGPTLRLGAFATFDAMALFLLAAAAWCVVAAKDRADSAFLLVAGTFLLALANATKYSTLLFDPSVIALAGLSIARTRGKKAAIARGGSVAVGVIALVGALLAVGGPAYVTGVLSTTLARAPGGSPPRLILLDAWTWAGLVVSIAFLGVAVCLLRRKYRPGLLLVSLLAASGALAPLNQARIHTLISLSKHVDFGAWFAAAAAGYAVSLLTHLGSRRIVHFAAAAIVIVGIAVPASEMGRRQAWTMVQDWPNSQHLTDELGGLTHQYPGHYLSEDYDVPSYYLEDKVPWQYWTGTWYFKYRPPGSARTLFDLPAYHAAINRHYFSLIILDFEATPATDRAIAADMRQAGDYQVVAVLATSVAQYTIWAYQRPEQSVRQHGNK